METFMDIMEIILFGVKAGLAVSTIVMICALLTWAHDELKEMRAERRTELARNREDLRQLKTEDTTYFSEWVAKHRRDEEVKKVTGKHRVVKGAPSYSRVSSSYAFSKPKAPIFNDENFFEALLKEREELAPIW